MFSRGRPLFTRAEETEAPAFCAKFKGMLSVSLIGYTFSDGNLDVQTVPPLGGVEFEMRDRILPPIISFTVRVDSSLKEYELDTAKLESLAEEALEMSKEGKPSLNIYLKFRKQVLDYCQSKGASEAVVVFRGEERGKTESVVRARRSTDPTLVTGRVSFVFIILFYFQDLKKVRKVDTDGALKCSVQLIVRLNFQIK